MRIPPDGSVDRALKPEQYESLAQRGNIFMSV